ncbi:unnamed protein product [Phaeothamnion confervicola]
MVRALSGKKQHLRRTSSLRRRPSLDAGAEAIRKAAECDDQQAPSSLTIRCSTTASPVRDASSHSGARERRERTRTRSSSDAAVRDDIAMARSAALLGAEAASEGGQPWASPVQSAPSSPGSSFTVGQPRQGGRGPPRTARGGASTATVAAASVSAAGKWPWGSLLTVSHLRYLTHSGALVAAGLAVRYLWRWIAGIAGAAVILAVAQCAWTVAAAATQGDPRWRGYKAAPANGGAEYDEESELEALLRCTPLAEVHVALLDDRVVGGEFVAYRLLLTHDDGSWEVWRRFSDFDDLRNALMRRNMQAMRQNSFRSDASNPGGAGSTVGATAAVSGCRVPELGPMRTHYRRFEPDFLAHRKDHLRRFLSELLTDLSLVEADEVREFCGMPRVDPTAEPPRVSDEAGLPPPTGMFGWVAGFLTFPLGNGRIRAGAGHGEDSGGGDVASADAGADGGVGTGSGDGTASRLLAGGASASLEPLDWEDAGPENDFLVRGATYMEDRVKVAAGPALLTLVAVDFFTVPERCYHIVSQGKCRERLEALTGAAAAEGSAESATAAALLAAAVGAIGNSSEAAGELSGGRAGAAALAQNRRPPPPPAGTPLPPPPPSSSPPLTGANPAVAAAATAGAGAGGAPSPQNPFFFVLNIQVPGTPDISVVAWFAYRGVADPADDAALCFHAMLERYAEIPGSGYAGLDFSRTERDAARAAMAAAADAALSVIPPNEAAMPSRPVPLPPGALPPLPPGVLPPEDFRNERFKLIPRIVEGPFVVRGAVGRKPALLGRKLTQRYFRGSRYVETDVDVASSAVASNIVALCRGFAKALVVELGICLEGRAANELPERCLGVMRLRHLDCAAAESLFKEGS